MRAILTVLQPVRVFPTSAFMTHISSHVRDIGHCRYLRIRSTCGVVTVEEEACWLFSAVKYPVLRMNGIQRPPF
jgi:hypothetical protein